jgi:hypothetical protein
MGEIEVFKDAARELLPINSAGLRFLDAPYVWVKMPMVYGLTDSNHMNEGFDGNVQNIKKFICRFFDDTCLNSLGGVLAVDLFIGNRDRFDREGNVINEGNIMFYNGTAIGLDTLDVGHYKSARLDLVPNDLSYLHILTDREQRKTFAENCMKSIGGLSVRALSRCNLKDNDRIDVWVIPSGEFEMDMMSIRVRSLPEIFLTRADVLEEGIATGAEKLKHYLLSKVDLYNTSKKEKTVPEAILQRMKFLNWY